MPSENRLSVHHDASPAVAALAAAQERVEHLPKPEPLTEEEYEERQRRLEEDIEDARKAFNAARSRWDQLCEEARELRYQWRQQKTADRATER